MPRRRSPGEGSVRYRKDTGRWQAGLVVGYLESDNPKRLRKDFATKREADTWLAEQTTLRNRGQLTTSDLTLSEMAEHWLRGKKLERRENSYNNYKWTLERFVLPHLGPAKIAEIKPLHIRNWLTTLQEYRHPETGKAHSAYTVFRAHMFLSMLFKYAVELEVIHKNPAFKVRPPKPPEPELDRLSASEVVRFLDWCRAHGETYGGGAGHQGKAQKRREGPHKVYRYAYLGLLTGMRREELLGLRWRDLDLEAGVLKINQSVVFIKGRAVIDKPKTPESECTVMLDPGTVGILHEQREHFALLRAAAGQQWREHGLVFPSTLGTPLPESTLRRWWWDAIEGSQVSEVRLYDVRATWISEALARGMNPKAVAKRVGHKDVAYMMKTYARPDLEEMRQAAKPLEQMYQQPNQPDQPTPNTDTTQENPQWQPVAEDREKGIETGIERDKGGDAA